MTKTFKPEEGELWGHPLSGTRWRIHSITTDGWVRYKADHARSHAYNYPLYTRPVLDFVKLYERVAVADTEEQYNV